MPWTEQGRTEIGGVEMEILSMSLPSGPLGIYIGKAASGHCEIQKLHHTPANCAGFQRGDLLISIRAANSSGGSIERDELKMNATVDDWQKTINKRAELSDREMCIYRPVAAQAKKKPQKCVDDFDDDNNLDTPNSSAGSSSGENNGVPSVPEARFKVLQKVYVRDEDGLLYAGSVRRALYGRVASRPVKLGYISLPESDELIKPEHYLHDDWHYYIHFDGWNTKWDRWVDQDNVFCTNNEVVKAYHDTLQAEHKKLRKNMMRANNNSKAGKKAYQNIDSMGFLQAWRKIVDRLDLKFQIPNPQLDMFRRVHHSQVPESLEDLRNGKDTKEVLGDCQENEKGTNTGGATKNGVTKNDRESIKRRKRSNATLEQEQKLRAQGLTKRRPRQPVQTTIVLPSTLKKVLVDQWEIICHCGMWASLPARVTVRHALDRYLASKGVKVSTAEIDSQENDRSCKPAVEPSASDTDNDAVELKLSTVDDEQPLSKKKRGNPSSDGKQADLEGNKKAKRKIEGNEDTLVFQKEESLSERKGTKDDVKETSHDEGETMEEVRQREWIEMTNGIAMFFDEAIENLLYREEHTQFQQLVRKNPAFKGKAYSELYGTEYLLRLFVRLPDLLSESGMENNEARIILAKVNDFVRFLHKNQANMFGLRHERPSPQPLEGNGRETII